MVDLAEIMTADVFTVAPRTRWRRPRRPWWRVAVGSAVVMQGRMLIGIFTERDVLRAAASGTDLTQSPVSRWMTRDPETVGRDVDVQRAAEIMLGRGFRHLPVVDETTLIGIVSLRDLLSTRIRRRSSPQRPVNLVPSSPVGRRVGSGAWTSS